MINVRIDTSELLDDRRKLLVDWLQTLGIDPADFGPWVLVKTNVKTNWEYELHLSKRRKAPGGGVVLDQASGEIVSEPLVLVLTDEQRRSMPKLGFEAVAR
jgi:hypothetical protein